MIKPATMSRRGFLQALGLTATTVLLGGSVQVQPVVRKVCAVTTGTINMSSFTSRIEQASIQDVARVMNAFAPLQPNSSYSVEWKEAT